MAQEAIHWCCPRHGWHLLHAHAGKKSEEVEMFHWLVVGAVIWPMISLRFSSWSNLQFVGKADLEIFDRCTNL